MLKKIKRFLSDLFEQFLDLWTEDKPVRRKSDTTFQENLEILKRQWTKPTRPIGQPKSQPRPFPKYQHIPLARYTDLNVTFQGELPVFHLGHYWSVK